MKPTQHFFTTQLVNWHAHSNQRSLPWKSEKDPYKIWLSEIILQQTRAEQALPYYLRFIDTYPTIADMAVATDDEVFRLWQGLGYYNRCKNMLATARHIQANLGGAFPNQFDAILSLKGIGPYTAAAISSFAFGLPHAVVDGNVYRVLARFFGIDTPCDTTEGKIQFTELANELLDRRNPAEYNQAIMDFGATVCTPRQPDCEHCPLNKKCIALQGEIINILPVKIKKLTVKTRYFHYLLLKHNDSLFIRKRTDNDIWANLHEPIMIESDHPIELEDLLAEDAFVSRGIDYSAVTYEGETSQRLTHQIIKARFFRFELTKRPKIIAGSGIWMDRAELKKTAFPKTLVSFLENNLYF
jgi:A/G-specific adenine glycosylase